MIADSARTLQCVEVGRGYRGRYVTSRLRVSVILQFRNVGSRGCSPSTRATQGFFSRAGSRRSTRCPDTADVQTLHVQTPETHRNGTGIAQTSVRSQVPPASIHDIDNGNILGFGGNLAPDHPGYGDSKYCDRRIHISKIAKQTVHGVHVPSIEYLPEEQQTWEHSLRKLNLIVPKWACSEYISSFARLKFQADTIPQLCDIQQALEGATGWNIRPTAGLMHPRDFLNGLAFKTFHSTQYVRHHSNPAYTPEPDVIHEILGHIPMLLCSEYCDIMEHIGQASLGASDAEIWQLTKVYWYTVEFGVVMEGNEAKAFGAGILSSYGELESMGTGQAEIVPLDLTKPLPKMSYKDGYQKRYFCLESFAAGAALLKGYSNTMIQGRSPTL